MHIAPNENRAVPGAQGSPADAAATAAMAWGEVPDAATDAPGERVPDGGTGDGGRKAGGRRGKRGSKPRRKRSALTDLVSLLLKIALVLSAFAAVFLFVFGVYRVSDNWNADIFKEGDVVMFYRLDKKFANDDFAVIKYDGELRAGRVYGHPGDEIDIDHYGLKINGNYQAVNNKKDYTQVVDGVTFPLVVPPDSVFLLIEDPLAGVDSRIYGCVPLEDVEGKVIAQFRRRGW